MPLSSLETMHTKASAFVLVAFIVRNADPTAIVNGKPTDKDEFPFMAALGWRNNATDEVDFLCGGALISAAWVLTAAHCVFFEGRVPDVIQIGGNTLHSENVERHTVKDHVVHPEYDSSQAYNDIALIMIGRNSWRTPAELRKNQEPEDYPLIAIGYGTTEFAGDRSDILLKIRLRTVPNMECQKFFKRKRQVKLGVQPSQMCAGDPKGLQDTCQGDSGGPLLIPKNVILGITSIGQACSGSPPAIYTRVSYYYDWIQKILGT